MQQQIVGATIEKQPSLKLQEKIKSCALAFTSLNTVVAEVIELGES